jgi:acetylornithine deacetylase
MTSVIAHLERLVGFATVSRDSNLDLIDYVRAELAGLGIDSQLVASDDGRKANLFATIGPADRAGIVLSGHTDVVPCEGQAWTSDPFAMRRDNGRLYGRGTADMKGFIACCLSMAREAVGRRLATPVHLAFSYDEEIGCIGVRRLLDMLAGLPVRPRFCIVGEPTLMQVATAHKGKASWRVVAHGLEAHSSLAPYGVNAIHLALDLIGRIRAMQDDIAATGRRDGDYDVPFTTLHVGRFAGGETINIVPNRASFDFEIRYLPGDDVTAMFQRIEAAAKEIAEAARGRFAGAQLAFEPLVSYPALDTAPDDEVVAFVRSLTGANATSKISFGTEGGLYQQRLGVPSVICGPGAIAVAHKPDEYVETAQLEACSAFLSRLVDRLAE